MSLRRLQLGHRHLRIPHAICAVGKFRADPGAQDRRLGPLVDRDIRAPRGLQQAQSVDGAALQSYIPMGNGQRFYIESATGQHPKNRRRIINTRVRINDERRTVIFHNTCCLQMKRFKLGVKYILIPEQGFVNSPLFHKMSQKNSAFLTIL